MYVIIHKSLLLRGSNSYCTLFWECFGNKDITINHLNALSVQFTTTVISIAVITSTCILHEKWADNRREHFSLPRNIHA